MSDPADKPALLGDAHPTLPRLTGKADPLPEPLVLVLTFFGSGSAGYFLSLAGVGIVGLVIGNLKGEFGHLGALQMNLSGLACAVFGTAIASAFQHRPIRGFALSVVATSAIAFLIGFAWYRRFAMEGYDADDVVIFLWPFVVSAATAAISVLALLVTALVHRSDRIETSRE